MKPYTCSTQSYGFIVKSYDQYYNTQLAMSAILYVLGLLTPECSPLGHLGLLFLFPAQPITARLEGKGLLVLTDS